MIDWLLITDSNGDVNSHDLFSNSQIEIRELDDIEFIVKIHDDDYLSFGDPIIIVGDIPYELEFSHRDRDLRVFRTFRSNGSTDHRIFYNFFGQSDVTLTFSNNTDTVYSVIVNILARKESALLADKMLSYITSNLEDAVQVCFSRSKKSATLSEKDKFEFTKIDIIKKSVFLFKRNYMLFKRENRYQWEHSVEITQRGQPTGPHSVDWALRNLDRLSPSPLEQANVTFNNRGYNFPELPEERLYKNTDTFENRVINSFLHSVEKYIIKVINELSNKQLDNSNDFDSDFVRFDHTMSKYLDLVVKSKIDELRSLSKQVSKLKEQYLGIIPSRVNGSFPPKMTSYAAKNIHYREAFNIIDQFNKSPSPSLSGDELLLGLKNLSIIYEITSLLLLHNVMRENFKAKLVEQSYRKHGQDNPYGGVRTSRPTGEVNNAFTFVNSNTEFELLYEPRIYPISEKSRVGDLIDTSRTNRHRIYGEHYFCPDFVLKISDINSEKSIIIIMDAKYKDQRKVRDYDLEQLSQKYLLNIHQLKNRGFVGTSTIKLVLALFAHENSGMHVSNVSKKHQIGDKFPVLPQTAGVLFLPHATHLVAKQIAGVIEIVLAESEDV